MILKTVYIILFSIAIFVKSALPLDEIPLSLKYPIEEIKFAKDIIGKVISYEITDRSYVDATTELVLAVFDTSKIVLTIINTQKTVHMLDYFGKQACPDAMIVISGGFFQVSEEGKHSPIGLLITGGKIQVPLANWNSGGVFHFTNNRYLIDPIRDFKLKNSIKEAIQSLPILVKNGVNDISKDDGKRWDRMSIGTTDNDQFIIIGAFSKQRQSISLYKFAEISIYAAKKSDIKLKDLIALDGAGGAAFNLRTIKRHYGYKKYKYVPNVLCVSQIATTK